MSKCGGITEREALNQIIAAIEVMSNSRPDEFVTPDAMTGALRAFVRRKNPGANDAEVDSIVSNIRGWLGSRYTMLSQASDYVDIERLIWFIKNYERSESRPYKYRKRRTPLTTVQAPS